MCLQDWKIKKTESMEEQKRCAEVEQVGVTLYPAQPTWVEPRPPGSAYTSAVNR